MLSKINTDFKRFFRDLAENNIGLLKKFKITPNAVTLAGCALCVAAAPIAWLERYNQWLFYWLAAGIFLAGSLVDAIDGGLARATNQITPFGKFLDSNTDRVSDGAILIAFAMIFLHRGNSLAVLLTGIAGLTCGLVPFARARAEAQGVELNESVVGERLHRLWIVVTGLILAPWVPLQVFVYLLVAISGYGFIVRVLDANKKFKSKQAEEELNSIPDTANRER